MFAYAFLFGLAFVWLCFAVVQDLRTREIANWLNFSLLTIALLYRGGYALVYHDSLFFLYGLGGMLFFTMLAYVLYYGHAFAGGDAKLLMALGPILPFSSFSDYIVLGFGFIFALFLLGSLYSLAYTLPLVIRKRKTFGPSFRHTLRHSSAFSIGCCLLGVLTGILFLWYDVWYAVAFFAAFCALPFLYSYARSIEQVCFIKRVPASRLTEGDWIIHDVRVGKYLIKANVHGLSRHDIARLRRANRTVTLKEGIPFSPAFLLAFVATVFYVLI